MPTVDLRIKAARQLAIPTSEQKDYTSIRDYNEPVPCEFAQLSKDVENSSFNLERHQPIAAWLCLSPIFYPCSGCPS